MFSSQVFILFLCEDAVPRAASINQWCEGSSSLALKGTDPPKNTTSAITHVDSRQRAVLSLIFSLRTFFKKLFNRVMTVSVKLQTEAA